MLAPSFDIPQLPPIRRDPQVTYVDRSGVVIGVRGGRYPPPVDIARLPAHVPAAFVAIEDRRFYEHPGFDAVGMARALIADLGQGRAAQGASTITQQLARNLFLSSDRTLERKGEELIYAVELEQKYSKQQILGLYLSRVYFGEGAYGIEAAAQRYFDKPANWLTVREAAMLAALMKSPTDYDPVTQPERSAQRTALVLDAMVETGAITAAQRARAEAQQPKVYRDATTVSAQYFVDWMDAWARRQVGQPRQDLVVETTLDLPSEIAAANAAAETVRRFAGEGVSQAALVSLDGEGRVRALVGGVDYQASQYDRALDAHRQAGSSWKPFVYLAAMEAGQTPDTMAVDEPVTIDGWSPKDFEATYLGQITLQTALAQSINTVAAKLADQVGRPAVAADARKLGITSTINTDPAMALGTSLVTPLEMATAYDAFANGGDRVAPYGVERIRVAGGSVLYRHTGPAPQPAIANPPLGELDRMLRAVIASGTGVHAAIPGHDIAGKTGTTSDYRDAWFDGFTGGLTTVVWMGRDDNSPMRGITGGSAPAAFWRAYMTYAVRRLPVTSIPPGPPPPATPLAPIGQPPQTPEAIGFSPPAPR
ncbi:MAG TPA: PBP1A family penicillin-binding protein [Caulobacteraceae bacterium]|nr:PBP1A family penicillin-binding protein [Caulobacteraceae bacterium]